MRNLFRNSEFATRNVIAAQVQNVIRELASGSFSTEQFLQKLDPYYKAIEKAGAGLSHFTEKQDFLNSVYEQFFQRFSPDIADTHGIVYTPREIVDYMCNSVEQALKDEFGLTLASPEVVILDPCTGTGNFIVNLVERIPGSALASAYKSRLFANEVMLLPYYVASLNIEHAYYERMHQYEPFEGLCFVDTLDMASQIAMFVEENTKRVEREKHAAITVIIGNPPYNVGQKSENDNNQNRKYKEIDQRIRGTYAKDSKATSTKALGNMYVKFFRWAADRLGDRDGIVCFVSNNNFVGQRAFDGMRRHLAAEFEHIDHVDLHGDVRQNPKLFGTTHNVFGIQDSIGITVAVKKKGVQRRLRYYRVPEAWRKREKLEFVAKGQIPWQALTPDAAHNWLVAEHADEYHNFHAMEDLFAIRTLGLNTNRDDVVYDFNRDKLASRIRSLVIDYNSEVDRHRHDPKADFPKRIKWSSRLKECLARGQYAEFDEQKIRASAYRPFTRKWVFLDNVLNQRTAQWRKISGLIIAVPGPGNRKSFGALMSDTILPLDLAFEKVQCFPLSHLKESAVEQVRRRYADPSITREDVFHYLYALLHHSEYRERFSANLKRELPRIPFAADFAALAAAGRELARLHVVYESLDPWPHLTDAQPAPLFSCARRVSTLRR